MKKSELLNDAREARSLGDSALERAILEKIDKGMFDPEPVNWSGAPREIAKNILPDTLEVAKGAANAILHPIDTTQGLLNTANSAVQQVMPDSVNDFLYNHLPYLKQNKEIVPRIGEELKNAFGSEQAVYDTITKNPAQVLSFVAPLIGTAGKLSKISALEKAGSIIDPLSTVGTLAAKGIGYAGVKGGRLAGQMIGDFGTQTGGESVRRAANAGFEGGAKLKDLTGHMRGTADQSLIVPEMRQALKNKKAADFAEYDTAMQSVKTDPAVLSMTRVKDAVDQANDIDMYHGISGASGPININKGADSIKAQITGLVDEFYQQNPAEFHTPGGLDALKRGIGKIRDGTVAGTPERRAADNVYNAVKAEIIAQAPQYGQIMNTASANLKMAKDIEKTLSLGEKSMDDTALRKLLSTTRNNAYTNYGSRVKLADELDTYGSGTLTEKLSGLALNTWKPRGIGAVVSSGTLGGSIASALTGNPGLAASLAAVSAAQSPRLIGELAVATGKTAKQIKNLQSTMRGRGMLANMLYQSDLLNRAGNGKNR